MVSISVCRIPSNRTPFETTTTQNIVNVSNIISRRQELERRLVRGKKLEIVLSRVSCYHHPVLGVCSNNDPAVGPYFLPFPLTICRCTASRICMGIFFNSGQVCR